MGEGVRFVLLLLTAWLAGPGAAAADDWLLELPASARSDWRAVSGDQPGLVVVYPRAGLPAVVAAGETLVVRVRVPAALTPPPGRQQERALAPWHAALLGPGEHAEQGRAEAGTPRRRYPLTPHDLRPDAGSSLVYRLSLPIPAWTAPGTYALQLSGPGGQRVMARAVRVLEAGRTPRLAWLPRNIEPARMRSLGMLPVDVWLASDVPRDWQPGSVRDMQPLLSTATGVAVRVGSAMLTLPPCGLASMADAATAARRGAIARDLGLSLRCLPTRPAAPAPANHTYTLAHQPLLLPALTLEQMRGPLPGRPWQAAAGAALEIDVTWPARPGGYRITGGSARFFAAGPPNSASPMIAGRLSRPAGAGQLLIAPAPGSTDRRNSAPAPRIVLRPAQPQAGDRVVMTVEPLASDQRVAWQTGEWRGGFGPGHWSHRFDHSGEVSVTALVIGPDGSTRLARRSFEVATARRSGCQLGEVGVPSQAWVAVAYLGLLSSLLGWRTRRRRALRGDC